MIGGAGSRSARWGVLWGIVCFTLGAISLTGIYHSSAALSGLSRWRTGSGRREGYSRALVIPRTLHEDISWAASYLPDYALFTFVADDPDAPYHPYANKGNEASTYLTYILKNYGALPDVSVFVHAHQQSWHNNMLHGQDMVQMLTRLRPEIVLARGYVNLRCETAPGCPDEIHPPLGRSQQEAAFAETWAELFPNSTLPGVVGVPCCAQFAVSREAILAHSYDFYKTLEEWLIDTYWVDELSGRFFEYAWHIIFGKPAVHCLDSQQCYCELYGTCFDSEMVFFSALVNASPKVDLGNGNGERERERRE